MRTLSEAHLSVGRVVSGRVAEHAAVEERAVDVGHHRAHVARGVRLRGLPVWTRRRVLLAVDELLHRLVPFALVALVDRVDLPARLNPHVRVRQNELAD